MLDYILIEDSIYVARIGRFPRNILTTDQCPRAEPSVVATLMAAATTRLGIVPTLSSPLPITPISPADRRHSRPDLVGVAGWNW